MANLNSNSLDFYEAIDSLPFDEFLRWIKARTEADWKEHKTISFEAFQQSGYRSGSDWKRGTKWLGDFTESDIDQAEQKWKIKFPPDYRQFLLRLGAPDQYLFGVQYVDNKLVRKDVPSFYNWLTDENYIEQAMKWPLEVLLSDIPQYDFPITLEKRHELARKLQTDGPLLVPLTNRECYLVVSPMLPENPVISIGIGAGELVVSLAAHNFKNFLLLELSEFLNINRMRAWEHATKNVNKNFIKRIPFWSEFILPLWDR